MDLTAVRGIGPAHSARLRAAGIPDAEALASFCGDFVALAQRCEIPASRLALLRDHARNALEERAQTSQGESDFPVITTPAHRMEEGIVRAVSRGRRFIRSAWSGLGKWARRRRRPI